MVADFPAGHRIRPRHVCAAASYPTGRLLSRRWLAGRLALGSARCFVVPAGDGIASPAPSPSVRGVVKPVEVDFPLFTSGGWAWPGVLLAGLLAIISVIAQVSPG